MTKPHWTYHTYERVYHHLYSNNVKYTRRKTNVYFISYHLLEERLYSNPRS